MQEPPSFVTDCLFLCSGGWAGERADGVALMAGNGMGSIQACLTGTCGGEGGPDRKPRVVLAVMTGLCL